MQSTRLKRDVAYTYSHRMKTRPRRSPLAACILVALTAGLAACGSDVEASGTFEVPDEANDAYTYDRAAVPVGAEMKVTSTATDDGGTVVEMAVAGFPPNRGYGAHAHVNPCGEQGDAAGPHFQNEQDPVKPSVDPAYANPENEIWLDFMTDAEGTATPTSQVPFDFAERAPASVVLHENVTATGPGEAGEAGARVACLTVSFG